MSFPFNALEIEHPAGRKVPAHSHNYSKLVITLYGAMTIHTSNGWWFVPPGLSLWIPSTITHSSSYNSNTKIIIIKFYDNIDLEPSDHCRHIEVSNLILELTLEAVKRFKNLVDKKTSNKTKNEFISLIYKMLVLQIHNSNHKLSLFLPQGIDKRLKKVTSLMKENPREDLKLCFLAKQVNTSERTLSRLFVTETGMSFRRWRQHMKTVMAVDLLINGHTISKVAFELGYSNESSFNTFFKRILGLTPKKYLIQSSKDIFI